MGIFFGVILIIFLARKILGASIESRLLYIVSLAFILINITTLSLIKFTCRFDTGKKNSLIKKIINLQISADLLVLTILVHYSGGLENPFFLYLLFHMIIASTLLSPKDSYLQASFAVLLLTLIAITEYAGIIPHYSLEGFITQDLYLNGLYLLIVLAVFATTSYSCCLYDYFHFHAVEETAGSLSAS